MKMTDKEQIEQIEEFLSRLKTKLFIFGVVFRPRDKNLDTLALLDITPNDRLNYLKNLKIENYYTGPNRDTFETIKPDYFEFGIEIKTVEIYIKISLGLPNKPVDCMSFHVAERPIQYPLKS